MSYSICLLLALLSCSFKGEIDNLCAGEVAKGQQLSCDTINAEERLNRAQLLVQSLGGAVCQPGGGLMG